MYIHHLGRILVVDDEIELTAALCEALIAHGYAAVGFSSGKEALAALAEQGFDLLLTDLMMPEMDGIALLRKALEYDSHLVGIIMTGQGTVQTAVEAMKIGAFDYTLKPFKLAAILPMLDRAMEVHRLRMENVQLHETVAIYELCTAVAYTLDLNVLLDKTIDAVLQQLGADEASIMLPTDKGNELVVAAVRGERRGHILGMRVPIEQGIAGWVARHMEPVTLVGEVNDPRFAPVVPHAEIGCAFSMPMVVGGKLVAVLNVNILQRRAPPTFGQIKALSILTGAVSGALESARLYGQVRQAEDKYHSIFENSIEGIFQSTPDRRFITANHALARMLGYSSPADLIAAVTDIERQVFVVPQRHADYARELEKKGRVTGFEFQAKRQDGSIVWFSENTRTVRNEQGTLLYNEGAIQDITARKQAEGQITRQLEQLEGLRAIDIAITSSMNLHIIFEVVLDQVILQLHVDAAAILSLNPDNMTLEYNTVRGFRNKVNKHTQVWQAADHAGRAVLERTTVSIPNLTEDESTSVNTSLLSSEGFKAYFAVPLIAKGQVKGVLEIFHRAPLNPEPEWIKFLETLAGQVAIAIDNYMLFEELQRINVELSVANDATLEGWSRALDLRDNETEGHTQRLTEMTIQMAQSMGVGGDDLIHIRRGTVLHDIGNMGIPEQILLKPGPLTDEEWAVLRKHPQCAYDLCLPIEYLRPALDIPYCHHEKWDGSGYPRGLKGEEIPLAARIFAVADVWDSLRSNRPYRKAWLEEKAFDYIKAGSGGHFDPNVVKVFLATISIETRYDK